MGKIWKSQSEKHGNQPYTSGQIDELRYCGIKEVMINDRQIFPIPSYLDVTNLTFIKLNTLSSKAIDVLSHCEKLENVAVGGNSLKT